MRRFLNIISVILLVTMALTSCKTSTYADKRKKEKAKLTAFIKDNGVIVKQGVADSLELIKINGPWPDKTFYKTKRGAYVRISKIDLSKRTPEKGNTIIMRWQSFDLDGNITGDNLNPAEYREGTVFVYSKGGGAPCEGWNDCIPFMRHDCQAEFIIESIIGPAEQQSAVMALFIKVSDFTVTN